MDYTKMRLGTKTRGSRKIARCPKCGRKGESVTYKDGDGYVIHQVTGTVMPTVTDGCYVSQR